MLAAAPNRNNRIKTAGFDLVLPRGMGSQPKEGFGKQTHLAAAAEFGMHASKVCVTMASDNGGPAGLWQG